MAVCTQDNVIDIRNPLPDLRKKLLYFFRGAVPNGVRQINRRRPHANSGLDHCA